MSSISNAATITWSLGQMNATLGDAVVYNGGIGSGGSVVWAYDFGSTNTGTTLVNGVTFQKATVSGTTLVRTGLNIGASGGNLGNGTVYYDTIPSGVSSSLAALYDDAIYGFATNINTSLNLSLSSLVVGQRYNLQLFMGDFRAAAGGRTQTVSDGVTTTPAFSQYVSTGFLNFYNGTFVADATTQNVTINGVGTTASVPILNAASLQAIPEPSTYLMVLMLGILFLSFEKIRTRLYCKLK